MCDVCDFVRQHAQQQDNEALDALLDDLLADDELPRDELYFELAVASGATVGATDELTLELTESQLDSFVRLVQLLWEDFGDSTVAAFQRGYVTGQQDLLAKQSAAASLTVH